MVTTSNILGDVRSNPLSRDPIFRALSGGYTEEQIGCAVLQGLQGLRSDYETTMAFASDDIIRVSPEEMARSRKEYESIPPLIGTLREKGLQVYLTVLG